MLFLSQFPDSSITRQPNRAVLSWETEALWFTIPPPILPEATIVVDAAQLVPGPDIFQDTMNPPDTPAICNVLVTKADTTMLSPGPIKVDSWPVTLLFVEFVDAIAAGAVAPKKEAFTTELEE